MSYEAITNEYPLYATQGVGFGATPAAGSVAASAETQAPLFEGAAATEETGLDTVSFSTKAETTEGAKAPTVTKEEIDSLKGDYLTKYNEIKALDEEIATNKTETEAAFKSLSSANDAVDAAYDYLGQKSLELAAAKSELEKLNGNWFTAGWNSIFNSKELDAMKAKVANLESEVEKAKKDYEDKVKEQKSAKETAEGLDKEGKELAAKREKAAEEAGKIKEEYDEKVATYKKETADLQQAAAATEEAPAEGEDETEGVDGEEAAEGEAPEATEEGEAPVDELPEVPEAPALPEIPAAPEAPVSGGSTTEVPSMTEEDKQEILDRAERQQQQSYQVLSFIYEFQDSYFTPEMVSHCFGFDVTPEQVSEMGLNLLGVAEKVGKAYATQMVASSYGKSGAMAVADTATIEEHSDAEKEFTEAVMEVSDIINGTSVEFVNITDSSNFELSQQLLSRIARGEYIKTSVLEKQTATVQGIQVQDLSDVAKAEDKQYKEYSDAILSELEGLTANPFQAQGKLSEEEFQAIESQFNFLAATDIEGAFDYLEDQARTFGIYEAVAA